jgi:hypothetical protein
MTLSRFRGAVKDQLPAPVVGHHTAMMKVSLKSLKKKKAIVDESEQEDNIGLKIIKKRKKLLKVIGKKNCGRRHRRRYDSTGLFTGVHTILVLSG